MPMISRCLSVLVILTLVGCASGDNQPAAEPIIVTPGGSVPGKVISVNPAGRFAVLRFPIGQMPPVDQRVSAYRSGLKVANLKISGPQRDVHTVADIIDGECRAGDEVRAD
jgi:hypothetical protein